MRALSPRFGQHRAARSEDVIDDGAAHVGAVDVQLDEAESLAPDVVGDRRCTLFLRPIGGCHGARDDGRAVEVARDVLLVSVEAL